MVGAKSDEHNAGEPSPIPKGEPPFNCMEDRSGIVHRTKGVDSSPETLLNETLTNAVGKATANEQHFFEWLNLEAQFRDVDDSPKIHGSLCRYIVITSWR
jgi:hypothetical protein